MDLSYATDHLRDIARRLVSAEENFLDSLMNHGKITREDAVKVLKVYRKARCVKLDAVHGVLSVKHGAFWDRDVILRALASAA